MAEEWGASDGAPAIKTHEIGKGANKVSRSGRNTFRTAQKKTPRPRRRRPECFANSAITVLVPELVRQVELRPEAVRAAELQPGEGLRPQAVLRLGPGRSGCKQTGTSPLRGLQVLLVISFF